MATKAISETAGLLRQLTAKSAFSRAEAVERLGEIRDATTYEAVERMLKDKSPEVRMRAAEALGRLDGSRSARLIEALHDRDELVRVYAAESLGAKAVRKALPVLRNLLSDPSPLVRSYVAAAIGAIGAVRDKGILRKHLSMETSDAARLGILEGLWQLDDHQALNETLDLLGSEDYRVRCATAAALGTTFLSKQTRRHIRSRLQSHLRREPSKTVRHAMRSALRLIEME